MQTFSMTAFGALLLGSVVALTLKLAFPAIDLEQFSNLIWFSAFIGAGIGAGAGTYLKRKRETK
ncbi:hypothetical protein ACQUJT_20340 [Ralstonia pseudosolanacearum]